MKGAIYLLIFLFTTFSLTQEKEKVVFNPEGGVHKGLKKVEVAIPKGYTVYYTTDGTTPTRENKRLRGDISLYKNTVFRFLIYDNNYKKEEVVHSYFIERKHSLGVVSIVTEPDHFFDSLTGIYAMGCCADTIDPFFGANFWEKWERPVNVEFFETDGSLAFNQKAGVRIFGGYSKSMPQKSLALFARKKYGDNRFRYKILPNRPFKKYKNFVLRNAGGDMLRAHLRDVYATQLIKKTGLLYQEYRPVSVYINGAYWGKYNLREKINEHFIKAHFGYKKDSLIIMRHNGDHQHGPPGDYRAFIKKLKKADLNVPKDLEYVHKKMDIENYILYNICQVYTGNGDAGGNIRYYKSMHDTAKWRWIFYDLDHAMNVNGKDDYKLNTLKAFTTYSNEKWPNPPWSTMIIRKILANDSLKALYINQFADLLNTTFTADNALHLIDKLTNEVSEEIDFHLKRWKIYRKSYDKSIEHLKIFAENRPKELWKQLMDRFDIKKRCFVKVIQDTTKGYVYLNTKELKNNYKGYYFQGIPIKFSAHSYFDYEFLEWKGIGSSKAYEYFTPKKDTLVIQPVFRARKKSEYSGRITITEIDATQSKSQKSGDWIEIYNNSDELIDLSKWQLRDDKDERFFMFPNQVKIKGKSFLIIAQNKKKFIEIYKDSKNVIGDFDFGIHKHNDKIRIYDDKSKLVDKINLLKFSFHENDTTNFAKIDYRIDSFILSNWTIERSTPGSKGIHYTRILKQEEKDTFLRDVFFYIGISCGLTFFILILVFSLRRKRPKN